jgi:hypothetical protein
MTDERNDGVVKFVTNHVPIKNSLSLVHPKATSPRKTLSPHQEAENENESSDDLSVDVRGRSSSVGAPIAAEAFAGLDEDESSAGDKEPEDPSVPEQIGVETNEETGRIDEGEQSEFALSEILESLGDALDTDMDESEQALSVRYIGVMEDREDLITVPMTKRVLSFNTLSALNRDAGHDSDLQKRARVNLKDEAPSGTSLLASFSLGLPALQDTPLKRRSLTLNNGSPVVSNSDEEALDNRLGEELDDPEYEQAESRERTPVPLLTPPGSPLTVEVDGGGTTTICEWPSNLVVDSAMQAVTELRPMSPASLETLERDEEARTAESDTTTLTPMLRSVDIRIH